MMKGVGKWLLFVAVAYLGFAMTSSINIGVRHVMPSLVCLLALGGRAAQVVLAFLSSRAPRLRVPVTIAGALSLVVGVVWSFPAYVGDFNWFIGNQLGRRAGAIAEDWGQDGADLARELHRRGIELVAYAPRHSFGVADLANEGLRVKELGCSGRLGRAPAAAIHLEKWERHRRCYRAFRKREPDFTIHDNILVFLAEPPNVSKPEPFEGNKRAGRRRHRAVPPVPSAKLEIDGSGGATPEAEE